MINRGIKKKKKNSLPPCRNPNCPAGGAVVKRMKTHRETEEEGERERGRSSLRTSVPGPRMCTLISGFTLKLVVRTFWRIPAGGGGD